MALEGKAVTDEGTDCTYMFDPLSAAAGVAPESCGP